VKKRGTDNCAGKLRSAGGPLYSKKKHRGEVENPRQRTSLGESCIFLKKVTASRRFQDPEPTRTDNERSSTGGDGTTSRGVLPERDESLGNRNSLARSKGGKGEGASE